MVCAHERVRVEAKRMAHVVIVLIDGRHSGIVDAPHL